MNGRYYFRVFSDKMVVARDVSFVVTAEISLEFIFDSIEKYPFHVLGGSWEEGKMGNAVWVCRSRTYHYATTM